MASDTVAPPPEDQPENLVLVYLRRPDERLTRLEATTIRGFEAVAGRRPRSRAASSASKRAWLHWRAGLAIPRRLERHRARLDLADAGG